MSYTTIARPYAKAVFEIAKQDKSFDTWSEQLSFLAALVTNNSIRAVIGSPKLTHQQRSDVLLKVCADKIDQKCSALLQVLSQNNRLLVAPAIYSIFHRLSNKEQKITEMNVTTANALTSQEQKQLAKQLSDKFKAELELSFKTDASIIGGIILDTGDKVLDASVKSKIRQLTNTLID